MDHKMSLIELVIVVGIALLFVGIMELRLSAKALPEPQTISYQQLASQGYGRNAHIRLTNFVPVTDWLIYCSQSDEADGPWSYVYFPAIADDNPWGDEVIEALLADRKVTTMPRDIHVLLKVMSVKDAEDLNTKLAACMDQPDHAIQGTIINEIHSVKKKEKALLQQSYPGIDVEKVLILEVGRTPRKLLGLGLTGGGGVCALVGLWLLIVYRRRSRQAAKAARDAGQPNPDPPPQPGRGAEPQSQRDRDAEQLAQFHRDEEQLKR